MLRPHSLLWHYLWLAPHILQVGLAAVLWRRKLYRAFPIFFAYLIFEAAEEFTLYAMDMLPSVSGEAWWFAFCAGLVVEGSLKLAVIGELFLHLLRSRGAIAKISKRLITGAGAGLVLLAVAAAAYVPPDKSQYIWTFRGHILQQSFYIVDGGLALFLFVFVAYSKLSWSRSDFGVALGFGILFCEHMATLSIMATGALPHRLDPLLDFLNLATYHICVLIWCCYLLIPQKKPTTSAVALPENNLAAWNRELERLIEQ
jgi:hypothetical protein